MKRVFFILLFIVGIACAKFFRPASVPVIDESKGRLIQTDRPFSLNENSAYGTGDISTLKSRIAQFAGRRYAELSEDEKRTFIQFNREKVVLLKKRMDERLERLKL